MIKFDLQTRGYEMDASKSIPPAVLLRYMENGRWQLSSPQGINLANFTQGIVVATQSLFIHRRVASHVDLEICAWLARVGNSSLTISQMICDKASREPVASGSAVLVNVDAQHRPVPLEDDLHRFVTATPDHFDPALFPKLEKGSVPDNAWHMERVVMASDLDLLNHVNHARYVDYVEDARQLCQSVAGYDEKPTGSTEITVPLCHALTIEYRQEVRHGKTIQISTWREDNPSGTSQYFFQIGQGDSVLANACVRCVE